MLSKEDKLLKNIYNCTCWDVKESELIYVLNRWLSSNHVHGVLLKQLVIKSEVSRWGLVDFLQFLNPLPNMAENLKDPLFPLLPTVHLCIFRPMLYNCWDKNTRSSQVDRFSMGNYLSAIKRQRQDLWQLELKTLWCNFNRHD
jgi:hypothetical protein